MTRERDLPLDGLFLIKIGMEVAVRFSESRQDQEDGADTPPYVELNA